MGRRKKSIPRKKTYSIIVDGDTEVWYFNMLKRNERHLKISIKPELPKRKKLSEQYHYVCSAAENYTKVFWVVDFDTILKETKDTRKGKETPLQEFQKYRNKLANKYDNVIVIINSPCLEFWTLLHFKFTSKFYPLCDNCISDLKKYLPDYEKTQKYYTKENDDIYLKLKPYLKTAIEHSERLGKGDLSHPEKAISEMNLFFNDEAFDDFFKN